MYDSNRNFGKGCATAAGIGMDTRAMLGAAPIQQTKSGEVQSEIECLEKELSKLHVEVDMLVGRLQPVSYPAPNGESPQPLAGSPCPVADAIQKLRHGTNVAAERLRQAREQLAI